MNDDIETAAILRMLDAYRDEYADERDAKPDLDRETRLETLKRIIEERDRNREGRNSMLLSMAAHAAGR